MIRPEPSHWHRQYWVTDPFAFYIIYNKVAKKNSTMVVLHTPRFLYFFLWLQDNRYFCWFKRRLRGWKGYFCLGSNLRFADWWNKTSLSDWQAIHSCNVGRFMLLVYNLFSYIKLIIDMSCMCFNLFTLNKCVDALIMKSNLEIYKWMGLWQLIVSFILIILLFTKKKVNTVVQFFS
jgi:hypothetical protein